MDASRTKIKRWKASLLGFHELEAIHKSLYEQRRGQRTTTWKFAMHELAKRGNKDKHRSIYEYMKCRHCVFVLSK